MGTTSLASLSVPHSDKFTSSDNILAKDATYKIKENKHKREAAQ